MRTALLGLLLFAAAAGAQEPAETFYETATVQARPLSAATGSVTVIDREAIEASGARTVGDLLRLAPGVSLTTNGRGGFSATFDHYEDVPSHIAEKVIEAHRKELEAAGGHGSGH